MIRRIALSLALLLATTFLTADASEPGRRRPVTNPQATVDGVIASMTPEGFRVQTPGGLVSVGVTTATEIVRTANAIAAPVPAVGDYTLTDALVTRDGSLTARRVALFTVSASVASSDTIRIEGKVAAVSPESSELKLETLRGVLLTVATNETTLIRRDGTAIGLRDITIGSIARVVGKPTGERTLLALEIDVHTTKQPPQQRDAVAGEVVEVRSAERTLVVRNVVKGPRPASDELAIVKADERTEIYRRRERIRFEEIQPGDFVFAQGELDAVKTLLAAHIDVTDPPEPAPMVAGRVLEVSATTRQFAVAVERGWMGDESPGPLTVVVSDDAKIYRDRELVRFDAIKPGDFVHVAGKWREDRTLVASVVHIVTLPPVPPMPAILGEIVEIESATRTLIVRVRAMGPMENATDGTVKVLVGEETKIFRNGEPSRFADLRTGEVVAVVGELREDRTLLAKRIDVIVPPSRPAHVMGAVASVGERSIDVIVPQPYPTFMEVRVTILVSDATEIFRNGERASLSEIKLGDMVAASGEWRDERTFFASRIEVKSFMPPPPPPPPVNLRGTIESVSPGGIRVAASDGQSWAVSVSRKTIITRDGVQVRFESLLVGERVEVAGVLTADRAVTALKIAVVAP
ncbi:MAG: DUF5666 domain-containing protein [Thermoanaerobaculia bacterium]|nr:DUF5666 domain-containing protein [Thermoanaerobaculia bacterium]